MSSDARLILKLGGRAERWAREDHGDYNLETLDREFRDRLYSEKGWEIIQRQAQARAASGKGEEPADR